MKIYELFFKPEYTSVGLFENIFKAKEYAEKYLTNIKWKRANDYLVADSGYFEIVERAVNEVSAIDEKEMTDFFGGSYDDN